MSLSAEEDDIPWDSMRDNRDLTVFTCWDPKDRYSPFGGGFGYRDAGTHSVSNPTLCYSFVYRQLTDEHRRQSLEEESMWLRIRSLTLRLLASLAALAHMPSQQNSEISNENGVGDKTSILSSLLSQLNQALQTAAQMAEKHIQVHTNKQVSVIVASLPFSIKCLEATVLFCATQIHLS